MEQEILESPAEGIFTRICIAWVNAWGKTDPKGGVDGRNEYATRTCRTLKESAAWETFEKASEGQEEEQAYANEFVEASARWHKTLIQSFTSVVCCYLDILDENIHKAMQKEEGISDWWAMPLI